MAPEAQRKRTSERSVHPLLRALEVAARGNPTQPLVQGSLAIGVGDSSGADWLWIGFGHTAQTRITRGAPPLAHFLLSLTPVQAAGLLRGDAHLDFRSAKAQGDRRIFEGFVRGYCRNQPALNVRLGNMAGRREPT